MALSDAELSDSDGSRPNHDWIGWRPTPKGFLPHVFSRDELEWCLDGFRRYSHDHVRIRQSYPFPVGRLSMHIRNLHERLNRVRSSFREMGHDSPTDEQLIEVLSRPPSKWMPEDVDALRKLVATYSTNWTAIVKAAIGTPLQRFSKLQMRRKWVLIKKEDSKPNAMRTFQILDVVDASGSPYVFEAKTASRAARKALPLGYELLRIQQQGDEKVHCYQRRRPDKPCYMKISVEDASDPQFRSFFSDDELPAKRRKIIVQASAFAPDESYAETECSS